MVTLLNSKNLDAMVKKKKTLKLVFQTCVSCPLSGYSEAVTIELFVYNACKA